jgi:gamma-tubulin complex component 5
VTIFNWHLRLTRGRRNVDFAAESSGEDDFYADDLSEQTVATIISSVDEDSQRRLEDYVIDTISKEHLKTLRKAQFWQKTPSVGGVALNTVKVPITELQASREVIFMLAGTATSLFETQSDGLVVNPSKTFCLTHLSLYTFYELLKSFAEQGSELKRLRSWIKRVEPIPLIQVFQATIQERLGNFDILLSIIQKRFLDPKDDIVVSLLSIREELASFTGPLVRVSAIIERLTSDQYAHAFRYLELLFDECCTSQMAGDGEMYKFLGEIFFECFQVYLRPIRMWMEEGEVRQGDKVFFVAETAGDIGSFSLWQSRFKIRRTHGMFNVLSN